MITNIDLDHLDYYKNLEDYISAFQSLVDQTSGYVIILADDENSKQLQIPDEKKIIVGKSPQSHKPIIAYSAHVDEDCCGMKKIYTEAKSIEIPSMRLQVP